MTVPNLVNVMAISSVVLNGLFNKIFVVHVLYMHRGAGIMAFNLRIVFRTISCH